MHTYLVRTMKRILLPLMCFSTLFVLSGAAPLQKPVQARVTVEYNSLFGLYKNLHANPELSFQEAKTAARLAKELKALGFVVTEKIGGHGVVGVFKNGVGPTVLVRADTDALPVKEATGLLYASQQTAIDDRGVEVPVMHACGHDVHMTCWLGAARVLTALKERWSGTLVFIAQPAEERGAGAREAVGGVDGVTAAGRGRR